jgi:hypothetical protein
MLRPSFVPPREIRRLRDYTRLRCDLTHERSRHVQRLEKLLEDALIKLSTVATDIMGVSGREMVEALIAGQRNPQVLAEPARGRMRVKRAALVQALTGQFDDHHAELARILLDQIDTLTGQIDHLTLLIDQIIAAIPHAQPPLTEDSHDDDGSHTPQDPAVPTAIDRLDEVPGIGIKAAQIILAEIGLDMSVFPTAGHLVSWARLCPRTLQSGNTNRAGRTGKGNPYLKVVLGEVAAASSKPLVAVARSILVIIWHLLADPTARFHDLGPDYYTTRIDKNRKTRNLVHQLQALGHQVTLNPAA